MVTNTSTLSQLNLKQASVSSNTSDRGMSLRHMLPMLLIDAVVPFLINLLARPYMSTIDALLLASSVPALYTLGGVIWKKRIDMMGVMVVSGLLLSVAFALLFNSPQLLLLRGTAVNGLLGVGMLVSLLFPRPLLFYVIRSIVTQHDAQRVASFNADWAFPQVRLFYRTLTIVWSCVTIAQLVLHTVLVFTLPISVMLMLGSFIGFAFIIPAAHWSIAYMRKNKAMIEQLRKERDAAQA